MTKKDKNPLLLMYIMFGIALVGGGFAIWFYRHTFCEPNIDCHALVNIEKWGQTGDFFGGILNPFFTFCGLFFVIITIKQNQQALKHNERELQLSSIQLRKSNDALQSQLITAEKQRVETTFFQLLSLFNGVIKEHLVFNEALKGHECPMALYAYLLEKLQYNGGVSDIEGINRVYAEFRDVCGYRLTGYFGTLYSIIRFVDNSDLSDENKKFYTNLVRSQISKYELGLLFYFCLFPSDPEYGKFLPLVKKYDLLKYLENSTLADPDHRKHLDVASTNSESTNMVD